MSTEGLRKCCHCAQRGSRAGGKRGPPARSSGHRDDLHPGDALEVLDVSRQNLQAVLNGEGGKPDVLYL
jgi:hypothetical protein